jgi:hypothetical protein
MVATVQAAAQPAPRLPRQTTSATSRPEPQAVGGAPVAERR